jgi:hypothetical protein
MTSQAEHALPVGHDEHQPALLADDQASIA